MNILLFGISNVGKTVIGKLLADSLKYDFYDIDEEVKNRFGITLEEFTSMGTLMDRDLIRCDIINSLVLIPSNKVIAVTPLSYINSIKNLFSNNNVFMIELFDSAENIFDRLIFSDENDVVYKDDEYKNKHKAYYLNEIRKDIEWYSSVNCDIEHKFDIDGRDPISVTETLIQKFRLDMLV